MGTENKRKYRGAAVAQPNIPHQDLVDLINAFCALTRRGATAVCRDATGDDKLLWDLNGGRRVGIVMRKALIDYIQEQLLQIDAHLNTIEDLLSAAMPSEQPPLAGSQTNV